MHKTRPPSFSLVILMMVLFLAPRTATALSVNDYEAHVSA